MIRIPTLLATAAVFVAILPAQTPGELESTGKRSYVARCAGCHGADGNGGGHGPAITGAAHSRATSVEAVQSVILHGIPGLGMPAFAIPAEQAHAIAEHVMFLKSAAVASSMPAAGGDPQLGERFYKAMQCAHCHMIRGSGGVLGPDLSHIGRERTPAQLEQTLLGRGAPAAGYAAATVQLRYGQLIRGIVKNESPFELQLLGEDEKLHLLSRSEIARMNREKSLMPVLNTSPEQCGNLITYLASLKFEADAPIAENGIGSGVPFSNIAHPQPGSWPTYNGNESGNRFSSLDQINTESVSRLSPRWMFAVKGAPRALEVTPVVVDGVMYVTTVNQAYALDARNGREIWHYSRSRSTGLAGDAASGINRGVAVLGDRVFMVTDNAHLLALHRLTGQLLWDATMADSRQNYGSTSAPLVVNDLVITGVSGGDEGVRGFLDAYKASTGERVWRFWTIPAPGEPGSETWTGRALEHGCGTTWFTGTYDPATRILYWPTGNPCPDYNGDERKGDNLYTASVLALDPETGKLKWFYQFTPHDLHDWDATETPVLVDAPFHGQTRKLLLHGNRNGFFYVLDRISGKVLLAEPFVKNLTWASGIGHDGRPQLLAGNEPTQEGQLVCPSVAGAANWPSSAYDPATGLFYMFADESCDVYSKNSEWWKPGESFYGGDTHHPAGDAGAKTKSLKALDIQTGKTAWEIRNIGNGILGSGLMATAGGLIFYGDDGGAFVAASSKDGRLLWHFNTGESFKGGPMTYTADSKQYVAIPAGATIIAFALQ